MSLATDVKDWNGLQLENVRRAFSSSGLLSRKNHWKTYYGLHSLRKFRWYFVLVFGRRHFVITATKFDDMQAKSLWHSPLTFFSFQLLKLKHLHCDDLHIILSLSVVQIYDYFIYSCSFLHLRDKYELSIDQLPVGLIAQLVRALQRYRRGHGFDLRSSLNIFSGFFFINCLGWNTFTSTIFI